MAFAQSDSNLSNPILTNYRSVKISGLKGLRVGPTAFPLSGGVIKPFSSDGCTMSPDSIPGTAISLVGCCVAHDIKYWLGGPEALKNQADITFRSCIEQKSNSIVAALYYSGVRAGGHPDRATSYRWGYGWNFLRPFAELKISERAQAEAMYGKDLVLLWQEFKNNTIRRVDTNDKSDSSLNPLSDAEVEAYNFLNNNLRTDSEILDVIHQPDSNGQTNLTIQLVGCPRPLLLKTLGSRSGFQLLEKNICLL